MSGAIRILLASRATQIPCTTTLTHLSRSYNLKKLISIQPGGSVHRNNAPIGRSLPLPSRSVDPYFCIHGFPCSRNIGFAGVFMYESSLTLAFAKRAVKATWREIPALQAIPLG